MNNIEKKGAEDYLLPLDQQLQETPFMIKLLTKKVINIASEEISTPECQILLKRKVITPVINMLYSELYPYIIAMIVSIVLILILSILTFLGFIFYLIKK